MIDKKLEVEVHINLARKAYHRAQQSVVSATESAMACGEHLRFLKDRVDHGEWLPTLKQIGINPRTAQRLVKKSLESGEKRQVSHLLEDGGLLDVEDIKAFEEWQEADEKRREERYEKLNEGMKKRDAKATAKIKSFSNAILEAEANENAHQDSMDDEVWERYFLKKWNKENKVEDFIPFDVSTLSLMGGGQGVDVHISNTDFKWMLSRVHPDKITSDEGKEIANRVTSALNANRSMMVDGSADDSVQADAVKARDKAREEHLKVAREARNKRKAETTEETMWPESAT